MNICRICWGSAGNEGICETCKKIEELLGCIRGKLAAKDALLASAEKVVEAARVVSVLLQPGWGRMGLIDAHHGLRAALRAYDAKKGG